MPSELPRVADAVAVEELSESVSALAERIDTLTDGLADIRRDLRVATALAVPRAQSSEPSTTGWVDPEEPADDDRPPMSVPPLRLDRQNSAAFEVLLGSGSGT